MKYSHRAIITAAASVAIASILTLWSWNTLADLFSWPAAEFRHVLAALFLLALFRFGIGGKRSRRGGDRLTHATEHHGE